MLQVRESQARTRDRLDQLLLENTQLRRKLLLKTQEFSDYRSAVESTNAKVIRSYKEKVPITVLSLVLYLHAKHVCCIISKNR